MYSVLNLIGLLLASLFLCNILLVIIIFYISLTGLLAIILAAHNQHHVHPDDTPCLQPPCHTLEYFTNNSDVYFVSNTTLLFGQGEYYHIKSNIIIQNVTNFSLLGISNHTLPVSVIKCLPLYSIYFYNVVDLTIRNLKFDECGTSSPLFEYSIPHYYGEFASLFFDYCTNINIANIYINNPVGYGHLPLM